MQALVKTAKLYKLYISYLDKDIANCDWNDDNKLHELIIYKAKLDRILKNILAELVVISWQLDLALVLCKLYLAKIKKLYEN